MEPIGLLTLLLHAIIFVVVVMIFLWLLSWIGFNLPAQIVKLIWVIVGIVILIWFLRSVAWAQEHHPPVGSVEHWYSSYCCSGRDCRPLPDSAVIPGSGGWELSNGMVVQYGSSVERDSQDERFHACINAVTGNLRCLYVPGFAM